jgi:hypothetical protein
LNNLRWCGLCGFDSTPAAAQKHKMQNSGQMDTLTAFGLFAVAAMLVAYALEERNRGSF